MQVNKALARRIFQKQLKTGIVKRPDKCSNCGNFAKIQAHHHDYTKPFSVVWLCVACHNAVHRKYNRMAISASPVDYSEVARKCENGEIKAVTAEKCVMVDLETHHKLKIMAAIRQLSIKQVLKELVEKAKTQETK